MWPLTYLPVSAEVATQLMALFAVSVIFVFTVFAVLIGRLTRERRELWRVMCPIDHRRALVIVQRSPDGARCDVAVHCSRWHNGKRDCGQRCLEKAA